ncbi:MAG: YqiA/YcfP family alpha/beta fold hydrolase [Gammaproteobacteria bacterium]|nr:YqiA/YcfP family alpha/beta fold hydrolase [Gammaproteobacteria bacterium]
MISNAFYLLYIHGFNSSPLSHKARVTHDYCTALGMTDRIAVPELSHVPSQAIAELCEIIEAQTLPVALIGSSLGGYYATWFAERYQLRAALINPAVNPDALWQAHLGVNRNYYSGRRYEITTEHVAQLQALRVETLQFPENLLLLAQTGDETLDYRLAVDKYKSSPSIIQPGGDHSFVNYEATLPDIFRFLAGPLKSSPHKETRKQ